jgi:PAS domain S-box-containing protein
MKRSRPELDPQRLRALAERALALQSQPQLAPQLQPAADADSDELKRWHELQVSQIELDLQHQALAELQNERDEADTMRQRYAALYEQAPAGYLSLDQGGMIIRANQSAGILLQSSRGALIGKRLEQFLAPQAQAVWRRFLARLFDDGAHAALEAPLFDPAMSDGASPQRRVRLEANLDASNGTCRMILTDIGAADVRDAARLRAMQVLDSIGEGVLVCDADCNIVSVNQAFTRLTGYAAEEALGRNPRFLGRENAHPPGYHAQAMRELVSSGRWVGDVHNRRRDGTPYTASMSLTRVAEEGGAISCFIGVFSDVTAQREAQAVQQRWSEQLDAKVAERTAELSASREQLLKLAMHLETVKEEERTRIARDIHDELGQNLLALRIDLSMLDARTSRRHRLLHQRVRAALDNVDATIRSVRGIMNELRPAVLDLGLHAALEWQAAEFRKRSGLACTLELPEEAACADVEGELAIVLFRSVQEALSNVRRHAQASRVDIALVLQERRLTLRVADDGVGLPPDAGQNQGLGGKKDSFGLIGMAQRVAAQGGSLAVATPAGGRGCRLTLSFDL